MPAFQTQIVCFQQHKHKYFTQKQQRQWSARQMFVYFMHQKCLTVELFDFKIIKQFKKINI